jgi:hypothetical protein
MVLRVSEFMAFGFSRSVPRFRALLRQKPGKAWNS